MTNKQQPKISIRNLKKAFGTQEVLRGLDLDVQTGQSVVIIGGSGVGKSVLIKCILGLLTPDAGSVKIDGCELVGARKKVMEQMMQRIGMLFQGSALFDSLSVWENVAFLLLQRGYKRAKAKSVAIEKLALVGMDARVADLYPAELSGGMKRRVALARAIAHDPEIIFFDEPTTGLDPIIGSVIDELIIKCVRTLKATAVTITHDIASARKIADRIAMLYNGKLIWDGAASEIDKSGNPYVEQFIKGQSKGPIDYGVFKEA